jgi:hypothetical protein
LYLNSIANFTRDFSVYDERLDSLNKTCSLQHPEKLVGCEDMVLVGDHIYTACLADLQNRFKYEPSYSHAQHPIPDVPGDKLFRWDLSSNSVVELELRGLPGGDNAESRSFHGLDVNVLPSSPFVTIFLINHLPSGSVIEKFDHNPTTSYATHVLRIETTADGAPYNPNNIFALPELDGESAMYVTNDHYYSSGFLRVFEYLARRPWSWVSYYSQSTGWKKVLPNVIGANGITGNKDPKNRNIYVSEVADGVVHVLKPDGRGNAGDLESVQRISVSMTCDNLGLFGDDLYIAGPAKPARYFLKDPNWASAGIGMVVKRINTKQLGSTFFGGGFTANPIIEELIMDAGKLSNISTTAIFKPNQFNTQIDSEIEAPLAEDGEGNEVDEQLLLTPQVKGDLYITGLLSKGKCFLLIRSLLSLLRNTYNRNYRYSKMR